ncbi:MAG TPA: tetratricopeptide repeat protein [Holophagaceae bacterium]|nr:tetratricopeptide repeat protein [Holophagaceae bacterium]
MPSELRAHPARPSWLRARLWLWISAGLLMAGALAGVFKAQRPGGPPAVYLMAARGDADIDPRALQQLTQWQLEACGFAVLPERVPGTPLPDGLDRNTLLLELQGRRDGDRLVLNWRSAALAAVRSSGDRAWRDDVHQGDPQGTLGAMLQRLPSPEKPAMGIALPPERPENFWKLLKALEGSWDFTRINPSLVLTQEILKEEPSSPSALILRGDLLYRLLLVDPASDAALRPESEACFLKALEISPDLPQAVFLLVQLRTDAGDHRGALTVLQRALRVHPYAPTLLTALGYAARTAGLLDLAREALERRNALGPSSLMNSGAENSWLYLGMWDRFEAELIDEKDRPRGSVVAFYRGYLALARGKREEAAASFHACQEGAVFGQFGRLGEIYELICRNRTDEARARLHALSEDRVSLHVPDGEFSFKLAEAYALIGDRGDAIDMGAKAFSQGFGCTHWYQHSPFVGDLQSSPRWQALLQHLQERQRLLEGRFPPSSFKP